MSNIHVRQDHAYADAMIESVDTNFLSQHVGSKVLHSRLPDDVRAQER